MGSTSISHVDVLIVGAGPAGLMAATWMARCGINTRIVDKRGTKIFNGYELIKVRFISREGTGADSSPHAGKRTVYNVEPWR